MLLLIPKYRQKLKSTKSPSKPIKSWTTDAIETHAQNGTYSVQMPSALELPHQNSENLPQQ